MLISLFLDLVLSLGQSTQPFSTQGSPQAFSINSPSEKQCNGHVAAAENCCVPSDLSNINPWRPRTFGTVEDGEILVGWEVEQVHMLARHGETYPDAELVASMQDLLRRIRHGNAPLSGDLAFVNTWEFFADKRVWGSLITTGCFAGTLEAFATGVRLRTRYQRLLDATAGWGKTSFWAAGFGRGIDTAKHFAAGFWGLDWNDTAVLHVIPQDSERAADTLTPSKTCLRYMDDANNQGHGYGDRMLREYLSSHAPSAVKRLTEQNRGLNITGHDVYIMQEICGFETIAKGHSPWCEIFSREEMEAFAYARDLLLFYRSGPGNPFSVAMGWVWLNATAELLVQGATAGPVFFSFAHDNDLSNVVSALGIYEGLPELPTTGVVKDRAWRASDITPMGGRIVVERLIRSPLKDVADSRSANLFSKTRPDAEVFVRVRINDGIVALPRCVSGPGQSCPLDDFVRFVRGIPEREGGGFVQICGLGKNAAMSIKFLHQ